MKNFTQVAEIENLSWKNKQREGSPSETTFREFFRFSRAGKASRRISDYLHALHVDMAAEYLKLNRLKYFSEIRFDEGPGYEENKFQISEIRYSL